MEGLAQVGYYFENIFSLKEFYLYRAIAYIHLKKFAEAIADFNTSRKIQKFDDKDPLSSMTLQSEKSHAEQTNTSSITEQEIIYNIILCYVAMGERQKC